MLRREEIMERFAAVGYVADPQLATAIAMMQHLRRPLLLEGDAALSGVLAHFPHTDRQHLRKLVRQARSERSTGQPAGASRRLFRYLRELQEAPDY